MLEGRGGGGQRRKSGARVSWGSGERVKALALTIGERTREREEARATEGVGEEAR